MDGSGTQKLNSDNSRFINVIGDWLYYVNLSDNNQIYKITVDGTNRTKISNDRAQFINVIGDWIFYHIDNPSVYKIKTDGTNRTKLSDEDSFSVIVIMIGYIFPKLQVY